MTVEADAPGLEAGAWSALTAQANAMCGGQGPRIAFCVAGAARTFSDPRVRASLALNAIAPLGGRPAVFAMLKSGDSMRKPQDGFNFDPIQLDRRQVHDLRRALAGWAGLSELHVLSGAGTELLSRFNLSHLSGGGGDCFRSMEPFLRTRIAHLHASWRLCREAILRHEKKHRMQFDLVSYSRPDLLWLASLPPWCAWNPRILHLVGCTGGTDRGCYTDFWFLGPRQPALDVLDAGEYCQRPEHRCCGAWRSENALQLLLRERVNQLFYGYTQVNIPAVIKRANRSVAACNNYESARAVHRSLSGVRCEKVVYAEPGRGAPAARRSELGPGNTGEAGAVRR